MSLGCSTSFGAFFNTARRLLKGYMGMGQYYFEVMDILEDISQSTWSSRLNTAGSSHVRCQRLWNCSCHVQSNTMCGWASWTWERLLHKGHTGHWDVYTAPDTDFKSSIIIPELQNHIQIVC